MAGKKRQFIRKVNLWRPWQDRLLRHVARDKRISVNSATRKMASLGLRVYFRHKRRK